MTEIAFPTPPLPPPIRGRLLTPEEVAQLVGSVSPAWVRRTVPHKLTLGHSTVRWYESDVLTWLEGQRS
jgi:predicted DNA-binding transcriptional regulator AlpA